MTATFNAKPAKRVEELSFAGDSPRAENDLCGFQMQYDAFFHRSLLTAVAEGIITHPM